MGRADFPAMPRRDPLLEEASPRGRHSFDACFSLFPCRMSQTGRVPAIVGGKVQKFLFKEEEVIGVFDLNNLYAECKADKKYKREIEEQMQKEQEESKKDK